MSTRLIRCQDCNSDYETKRSNTKYCGFHSFHRGLLYIRARLREEACPSCGRNYLPTTNQVRFCGECYPPPTSNGVAECAFCGEVRVKVHKDVRICSRCAQLPSNDGRLLKRMNGKSNELKSNPIRLTQETT